MDPDLWFRKLRRNQRSNQRRNPKRNYRNGEAHWMHRDLICKGTLEYGRWGEI
ncbi:Alpha/beta hydrolase family protein [Sesbania bispinosa]|nr:Alpha/beta hydrolase family protein [Sesbania bispinosa]